MMVGCKHSEMPCQHVDLHTVLEGVPYSSAMCHATQSVTQPCSSNHEGPALQSASPDVEVYDAFAALCLMVCNCYMGSQWRAFQSAGSVAQQAFTPQCPALLGHRQGRQLTVYLLGVCADGFL